MKSFVVFALVVAAAVAAPLTAEGEAQILEYQSDNIGVDGFNYGYKTSNGIQAQETGVLEGQGTQDEGISVSGSYSYVGLDGVTYNVVYTAGKEGFVPKGDHIA